MIHKAYKMSILMSLGFWSECSEETEGETDADVRSFLVMVSRQRPRRKGFFVFFPPTPSLKVQKSGHPTHFCRTRNGNKWERFQEKKTQS